MDVTTVHIGHQLYQRCAQSQSLSIKISFLHICDNENISTGYGMFRVVIYIKIKNELIYKEMNILFDLCITFKCKKTKYKFAINQ